MEKTTPVRKSHTSTADLLVWSESDRPPIEGPRSSSRPHQPSGGISAVMFGAQMTEEEADSVLMRKTCSDYKLREITGSGIFATGTEDDDDASESGNAFITPNGKTGLRHYQQAANAISHISFEAEESVSPKKPSSIAEVAKQRELSGSLAAESDALSKKQISGAKFKELTGNDIFGPPPEIPYRPLTARHLELKEKDVVEPQRNIHTSIKVSNPAGASSNILSGSEEVAKMSKKMHNLKLAELSGNDIFKGDAPPGSAEKSLSVAKLREMSGSDIFADGKSSARDYFGGVRKPPGGESSIALV